MFGQCLHSNIIPHTSIYCKFTELYGGRHERSGRADWSEACADAMAFIAVSQRVVGSQKWRDLRALPAGTLAPMLRSVRRSRVPSNGSSHAAPCGRGEACGP